jgi:hypothetical protein
MGTPTVGINVSGGNLRVYVTPASATSTRWVATIRTAEVVY